LSKINSGSKLISIESDWTFTPGKGGSGSIDLLANLYSPSLASGVNTNVGFATTLDLSQGAQTANSIYSAQNGLNFGPTVIAALLAGGHTLSGELVGSTTSLANLSNFFKDGGTAVGTLKLITLDPGASGGGGTPTPEPASMLVWGAVAAGAMLARRRSVAA
jgi:hypothetical protein